MADAAPGPIPEVDPVADPAADPVFDGIPVEDGSALLPEIGKEQSVFQQPRSPIQVSTAARIRFLPVNLLMQ